MARYRMSDGMIVDTEKASDSWGEETEFDGRNQISVVTHSQWEHETLYRSKRGRYYVVRWSQRQGTQAAAEWVDAKEAARWLMLNKHELPEDLVSLADDLVE